MLVAAFGTSYIAFSTFLHNFSQAPLLSRAQDAGSFCGCIFIPLRMDVSSQHLRLCNLYHEDLWPIHSSQIDRTTLIQSHLSLFRDPFGHIGNSRDTYIYISQCSHPPLWYSSCHETLALHKWGECS